MPFFGRGGYGRPSCRPGPPRPQPCRPGSGSITSFFGGPSRYGGGSDSCRDRRRRLSLDSYRRNCGPRGRGGPGCGSWGRRPGCFRLFPYGGCNWGGANRGDDEEMCGVEVQGGDQDGQDGQEKPVVVKPDATVLKVKSVDLCIDQNSKSHKTDRYEISKKEEKDRKLVVRRGQPFNFDITFNKEYDAKNDDLKLVFEIGDEPLASKNSSVEFALSDKDKYGEWGAKIVSSKDKVMTVQVFTPPDVCVGKWDLSVEVIKDDETSVDIYKYEHEDPIYVIFNPWCKEDSTYLEDEDLLKEYVLNETGKIYSGSHSQITSKPWNFGQFESCVLDVSMYLLDESGLNWTQRGNPVHVLRKISAMVNSSDEGGVLTGNWSGDYSGGRSPLSWTGSVAILEEYWGSKVPVKFGQCWVFSGLCTTVCRALGLPARSVTNFASAHDTDGSVTIDSYFTAAGEPDGSRSGDSVWNFHVWNEGWCSRPELPKGFGGWQAFDATPQEASGDVYCCGPVSVQAIKTGEINYPYDGPFVFAEVNADRMYWVPDGRGKFECVHCDEAAVGKKISTKAPNKPERLDVTNRYKPEEGTPEERAAVLKANQMGSTRRDLYKKGNKDVTFEVKQDTENTWWGGDFEAHVAFKNTSKETRTVSGRINVSVMYYTGVVGQRIKSVTFEDVKLEAGEESEKHIKVEAKEYEGKLLDCAMFDMAVWATVKETNQIYTAKNDFRLRKPHLTIKAPEKVKAGEEFHIDVSFTNPHDGPLTECFVAVDGLAKELKFPQGSVKSKGTFMATLPITPKKLGQLEVIVSFNSKQLEDVNGSLPVFVQDSC